MFLGYSLKANRKGRNDCRKARKVHQHLHTLRSLRLNLVIVQYLQPQLNLLFIYKEIKRLIIKTITKNIAAGYESTDNSGVPMMIVTFSKLNGLVRKQAVVFWGFYKQ